MYGKSRGKILLGKGRDVWFMTFEINSSSLLIPKKILLMLLTNDRSIVSFEDDIEVRCISMIPVFYKT